MPIFVQIWLCLPLWVTIATLVCLLNAALAGTDSKRALWQRWTVLFGFTLVTSLFWANPTQMLSYSGPFAGRVIDADTGEPVSVALLAYQWQGALGQRSTHRARTLTAADGSYRLGWQGFGNWRIGAWPGPDSFYVQAPGYATTLFFLDGKQRDPYGEHDETAKSATISAGTIRLQPLRSGTKFNLVRSGIPFGANDYADRIAIAHWFHEALFPRLCPENGQTAQWEPTDAAFVQLLSVSAIVDPANPQLKEIDTGVCGFPATPGRQPR